MYGERGECSLKSGNKRTPRDYQTSTRIAQRAETANLQGRQENDINTTGYNKQLDTIHHKNLGAIKVHVLSAPYTLL